MPGASEGPPEANLYDIKTAVSGILDTHDEQTSGALEQVQTGIDDVVGRLATLHATMLEVVAELYALDDTALDNAAAIRRAERTSEQTAAALAPVVTGSARDVVSNAPNAVAESAAPLEDVKISTYSVADFLAAAAAAEEVKDRIETLQQEQALAKNTLGPARQGMVTTSKAIRDAVNES